jgi:hypothetical protein
MPNLGFFRCPIMNQFEDASNIPLMTREKWAAAIGLPVTVLISQTEKGYWPLTHIGKRVFINVEAVRIAAAKKAEQFTL